MFRKAIAQLQSRKEQLVAQSEANRSALAADWRRLHSPDCWWSEAGEFLDRHPLWRAALAATAVTLAFKFLGGRGSFLGRIGRLGKLASVAFSAWKLFSRIKSKL